MRIEGNIQLQNNTINILAPAKAAFYSAVLPGLGQAYNKQYWKIPVVYVAIGTGTYFYISNSNEYKRYKTAYYNRKNGLDDEFPNYSTDVLISAQKIYKRQRDTSLMITVVLYLLNVVDANVSAHLKQWNVNDNLSFSPVNLVTPKQHVLGLQLNIRLFK